MRERIYCHSHLITVRVNVSVISYQKSAENAMQKAELLSQALVLTVLPKNKKHFRSAAQKGLSWSHLVIKAIPEHFRFVPVVGVLLFLTCLFHIELASCF